MLARVEMSGTQRITYTQEWNVENRLSVVTNTVTGDVTRFVYDGDGNRVLREDPSGLTVNVGAIEVSLGGTQRLTTTYYFAGGQRIAMRKAGEVTYLHGDHLGSASLATNASGAKLSDMRYTPFGEVRYGDAPTDRRFTGQREEAGIGLYDFNARYYSSGLGRFVSADSLVPDLQKPQDFNRYSYARNSPIHYADPSGNIPIVIYDPILKYYLVAANLQLYGSGAFSSVAADYKQAIEEFWNRNNPTHDGMPVYFRINAFVKEPKYGDSLLAVWGYASPLSGEAENLVHVAKGALPEMGEHPSLASHFLDEEQSEDFDYCTSFYEEMDAGVLAHEAAHIYGIYVDRYNKTTNRPYPLKAEWAYYVTANPNGYVLNPDPQEITEIIQNARARGQVTVALHLPPVTLRYK